MLNNKANEQVFGNQIDSAAVYAKSNVKFPTVWEDKQDSFRKVVERYSSTIYNNNMLLIITNI